MSACAVLNIHPIKPVISMTMERLNAEDCCIKLSEVEAQNLQIGNAYEISLGPNSPVWTRDDDILWVELFALPDLSNAGTIEIRSHQRHLPDAPGLGNGFFVHPILDFLDEGYAEICSTTLQLRHVSSFFGRPYYGGEVLFDECAREATYMAISPDPNRTGRQVRWQAPTSEGLHPMSAHLNYEGSIRITINAAED